MALRIICSGHLVRYPLGGHSWHHLQYLVGLRRLGHQVTFVEDYGWPNSCYDPARCVMTADPGYGLTYVRELLDRHGLADDWCYLAEDGTAHGMPRERVADLCRQADLYVDLSHVNWIPEFEHCRRRVLVDTDPVLTQIGAHGLGKPLSWYHRRFTYGENVHQPGSEMPTAGERWMPTRQPVVLDLWPVEAGDRHAPLTTVMNWSAGADRESQGRVYGQKDREFQPFLTLPREIGEAMELTVSAPSSVLARLAAGGWRLADPRRVTRTPWSYQEYLRGSRAEFCVAKHAYVSTQCGWFSDRSTGYLASGRPVIVQDTGFSRFLPTEAGLLAFRSRDQAVAAIRRVGEDYDAHCRTARQLAADFFDAGQVLSALLERSL
jgi:hypothetical protein